MKKKFALGALCFALALSFISCDLPDTPELPDTPPTFEETDYVKLRKEGKFKKIPSWIKGYWSDSEDKESYFFTDNNLFYDLGRSQSIDFTVHFINPNFGKFTEEATDTSYTVTFRDYYKDDSDYDSHTKKDAVLKFEKTATGISCTEIRGDTVKPSINLTKGKLLIPTWLRETWASSNGFVVFKITDANIVMTQTPIGNSMDYTTDIILPYIYGVGYCEYVRGKGYIEETTDSSYTITITDGKDTIVTKLEKKDANTITWTNNGEVVGDLTKQ